MQAPAEAPAAPALPPAPGPAPVAITELARRLGLSRKAVTGHIERGTVPSDCLERGPHGWRLLDAERAEEAIRAKLEEAGPRISWFGDDDEKRYANLDFNNKATWPKDAKALQMVREYWNADAAKRKADIASRDLVRTDDVHRELFTAARTIRDQLVTFPDRFANDLAADLGVADVTSARNAMQASIDRMLTDLSTELERALIAAGAGDETRAAEDDTEGADGGAARSD